MFQFRDFVIKPRGIEDVITIPLATFYFHTYVQVGPGWFLFHEPGEPTGASEVWSVWTLSPACWHLSRCMRRGDQDLPVKIGWGKPPGKQLLGWDNMIGCQMTHELCVSINCINVYLFIYLSLYIYIHTCHMSFDIYIYIYVIIATKIVETSVLALLIKLTLWDLDSCGSNAQGFDYRFPWKGRTENQKIFFSPNLYILYTGWWFPTCFIFTPT